MAGMRRSRGNKGATAVEYTMIVAMCGFCALGFIAVAKVVLALIINGMQGNVDAWVP